MISPSTENKNQKDENCTTDFEIINDCPHENNDKIKVVGSFDDMNLNKDLLRGIYVKGFRKPSAIQQLAIVPLIKGRQTIVVAQSGAGKTATFIIAALQSLDVKVHSCQVIILAATRELANQIHEEVKQLSAYMNVSTHVCIGGTKRRKDVKRLKEGVQVVVGTPGRVIDLMNNR